MTPVICMVINGLGIGDVRGSARHEGANYVGGRKSWICGRGGHHTAVVVILGWWWWLASAKSV